MLLQLGHFLKLGDLRGEVPGDWVGGGEDAGGGWGEREAGRGEDGSGDRDGWLGGGEREVELAQLGQAQVGFARYSPSFRIPEHPMWTQ